MRDGEYLVDFACYSEGRRVSAREVFVNRVGVGLRPTLFSLKLPIGP